MNMGKVHDFRNKGTGYFPRLFHMCLMICVLTFIGASISLFAGARQAPVKYYKITFITRGTTYAGKIYTGYGLHTDDRGNAAFIDRQTRREVVIKSACLIQEL